MEGNERQSSTGPDAPGVDPIQGEGDYRSARDYREDVQQFLQHADVEKAARDAAPRDRSEARELEQAEAQGRSSERMRHAARSLARAVQQRPVIAIIIVGALGYLLGRVRRRGSSIG